MTPVLDLLPAQRWPPPPGDALLANLPRIMSQAVELLPGASLVALERVQLESPVACPGRVLAVRGNYPPGDADAGLFLKAPSSVAGPSRGIELRFPGRRVDHEVELVAVIGERVDRADPARALAAVAGYCIGVDVTLRGEEDRGLRKSLDGYTVLGPWLTTPDEVPGIADARIELAVNGTLRQSGRTSQMSRGIGALIAEASRWFVLQPGDVVMTGTPTGVGPLLPGDCLHCAIEGIGAMKVAVR